MSAPKGPADSPNRASRLRNTFVTGQVALTEKRDELRNSMHRKTTVVVYEQFMADFMPTATLPAPPSWLSSLPKWIRPSSSSSKRTSSESTRTTRSSAAATRQSFVNPFKDWKKPKSEREMYTMITSALNKSKICEGYTAVATPHKADKTEDTGQAVDCGLYPDDALDRVEVTKKTRSKLGRTDWSSIEIAIECKMDATAGDPFDDTRADNHYEPEADSRRKVLGQVLNYAELVFERQHRTAQYMLLFLGEFARIIRIDRAGLYVTSKFNYRTDGTKLAAFLHHYTGLAAAERGHDITAVRLHPKSKEAEHMRERAKNITPGDYVAEKFAKLLDPEWPWWKLEVTDELNRRNKRFFLVGKPHFQAPGVAGRATRGYIALDADSPSGDFVYLKDAWRVVSKNIDKEGAVLKALSTHRVQYVPTLICHGDIPGQKTESQAVWQKRHPKEKCHMKHHQHYRLVTKEVGKPLEEVSGGPELMKVMFCAVLAHSQAYKNDIIHRDISAGNILIYKKEDGKWYGLLNDWELSKKMSQQVKEGRQPDRTGTWQFMSAKALNDFVKTIVIQDELEAFFHVTLYIALRLLPHNCPANEVPRLLHDYFDDYSPHANGHVCGKTKRQAMRNGYIDISTYNPKQQNDLEPAAEMLHFVWPGELDRVYPLETVLATLLSWFSAYYTITGPSQVKAANPGTNAATFNPFDSGLLGELTPPDGMDEVFPRASASTSQNPLTTIVENVPSEPSREALEELAKNLESHQPLLQMLWRSLKQDWPVDNSDRCADKKPDKDWTLPKEQIKTGSKRGSGTLENAASSSKPAKRTKT